MGQDLSIEHPKHAVFITIRTVASRLWLVNNPQLHNTILGFLAKYQQRYSVVIYGFIVMGNHYHLLAQFPLGNRAAFLRDFNSIIARLVSYNVPRFNDGRLWARRARVQVVPNPEDILDRFLYLALNPVSSGLCERLSEYGGYNCINDVLSEIPRIYKLVDWREFRDRSRYNSRLQPKDFQREYSLTFSRLPGLRGLSRADFQNKLQELIGLRRQSVVKQRRESRKGFAGTTLLKKMKPGAYPKTTKKSTRDSKRPLVLTLCMKTRAWFLDFYFATLASYRRASERFRAGDFSVTFPPCTHRPVVPAST